MRKIVLSDVPKLARIIKTTNTKEAILKAYEDGKRDGADAEVVAATVFFTIFENCGEEKTEKQIYELLAGIMEKTPEEVQGLSVDKLIEDIKVIAEENNLVSFFKSALKVTTP
jgi:uncharacterized protein YaaR (DUF327 family)